MTPAVTKLRGKPLTRQAPSSPTSRPSRGPAAGDTPAAPTGIAASLAAAGFAATTASTHKKTHSLLSSAGQLIAEELEEVDSEVSMSPSHLHNSAAFGALADVCAWVDSSAHIAVEQVPDARVAAVKPRKRKERDDSPVSLDGRKRGSFHDDESFLDLQQQQHEDEKEDDDDEEEAEVGQRREFAPLHATTPWESSDHRFDVAHEEEEPFQFLSGTEDDQDARLRGVTTTTTTTTTPTTTTHNNSNNISATSVRDSGHPDVESKADESPFGTPPRRHKFANASVGLYMGSPVSAMELGEFIFWPTSVAVESVHINSLYSWMHGAANEELSGIINRSSTQLDIHQLAKLAEFSGHDEAVFATVWP